jgi:hypothetical protein
MQIILNYIVNLQSWMKKYLPNKRDLQIIKDKKNLFKIIKTYIKINKKKKMMMIDI